MEILSDAVFHGDVSIGTSTNPKTLKLYTNGNGNVLTIGETGGTEILKTDGIVKFESINANYADICSLTVYGNNSTLSIGFRSISCQYPSFYQGKTKNRFYFGERENGKTYYIATQDQITSAINGMAHIQSLPIDFDVPAECTRFYVKGANSPDPFSIQLFKAYNSGDGHSEHGYMVKTVDLGIVCGDSVEGCVVVVEKSSSFAMRSDEYYSIRLVY